MVELPTYTSVFRLERRLYAIYDWELPVPVGVGGAAAFVLAALVFLVLGRVLNIELTAGTAWFYVVPPAFAAYLARRPVADAKQPHAWAVSQLRFLLEPRVVHRLADPAEASRVVVSASAWHERRPRAGVEVKAAPLRTRADAAARRGAAR